MLTDANYKALVQALEKGVLWSDGTDLFFEDYTGHAGEVLTVNPTATGVLWNPPAAGTTNLLGVQPNHVPVFPAANSFVDTTNALTVPATLGEFIRIRWRYEAQSPHIYAKPVLSAGPGTVSIIYEEKNTHADLGEVEQVTVCGESLWYVTGTGNIDISMQYDCVGNAHGTIHPTPLTAAYGFWDGTQFMALRI